MKAICIAAPQELAVIDIAEPSDPGPGQAVVKTHRMGVCGTDYSTIWASFLSSITHEFPAMNLALKWLPWVTELQT